MESVSKWRKRGRPEKENALLPLRRLGLHNAAEDETRHRLALVRARAVRTVGNDVLADPGAAGFKGVSIALGKGKMVAAHRWAGSFEKYSILTTISPSLASLSGFSSRRNVCR